MHTWVLLTEQLQLTAVWDSNMSGTSQWCAPQPSAPLANCTQHDSLIRTQLTPCEEGGWRTHTHACMHVFRCLHHTLITCKCWRWVTSGLDPATGRKNQKNSGTPMPPTGWTRYCRETERPSASTWHWRRRINLLLKCFLTIFKNIHLVLF